MVEFAKKIIDKYRKEAEMSFLSNYNRHTTWRAAILESIFRPVCKVPGKTDMSHLHPNIDKLHLPHGVYIADWRKYRVEDHPALIAFQKRCHAAGLNDPWLRNFAHGFYPNQLVRKSLTSIATTGMGAGFLIGFSLFLTRKAYLHFFPITYQHTPEYIAKYGTGEVDVHL